MANAFFDSGLDQLGEWEVSTFRVLLATTSYTFDVTDVFVADLVADELASAGYARATISTPVRNVNTSLNRIEYQCDSPLSFGTPAIGGTYRWGILYKFVTNDAASPLVGAYDIGNGSGISTDGAALSIPVLAAGLAFIDDQT